MAEGSIPGGKETVVLNFSALPQGYYELNISSKSADGPIQQLAKTSFSVLDDFEFSSWETSPFGINLHLARGYQGMGWTHDLLKEAYAIGAVNVRDGTNWETVEKEKGKYEFGGWGTVSGFGVGQFIRDKNMNYLYVTGYTNPNYDNNSTPYTDEGRAGYAAYSKAAFDNSFMPLYCQEMYNEWYGMGNKGSIPEEDKNNPKTYVKLTNAIYQAVSKEEYPQSMLFGAFSGDIWNTRVIENGIIDSMDGAAIHIYPPYYDDYWDAEYNADNKKPENGCFDVISRLREQMDTYSDRGKSQPIWLTETGYATSDNRRGVSEKMQATYLPRLYLSAIAAGAEKIFWYDLLDDGTDLTQHENNFGLLRCKGTARGMGDYTPKPAYVAYGVMARMLDGFSFNQVSKTNGIYDYTFVNNGRILHAVYSETSGNLTIPARNEITVVNIMGESKSYLPQNNLLTIPVSQNVCYFEEN